MRIQFRVRSDALSSLDELFETRVTAGIPSVPSAVISVAVHALIAAGLAVVHFPGPPANVKQIDVLSSTQIKVGEKLYYVARLPPRPVEKRPTDRPKPGRPRLTAPAPSPEPPRPAPAAPLQASAPKVFVPPEVKRNPAIEETLIQPSSPPDIQPRETSLPSFRVWTGQFPKIPKPFVAPGRRQPPPPDAQPLLAMPSIEFASANPQPLNRKPALVLPPAAPPVETAQPPDNAPPLVPQGDPVNIISLSRNPVLPGDTLVVPPGNIVGMTGNGIDFGKDSGNRSSNGSDGASGNGSSSAAGAGSPGTAVSHGSGTPNGSAASPAAASNASGGSAPLSASRGPGSATGTNATGPGAAGTGTRTVVITRPVTGNFDAVVVQSSPLDLFPDRKNLLTGRPVYTVYVAVGTAKDWALYYCIPSDGRPESPADPRVVTLTPVAPLAAPYPVRIVRPLVALPSYEKYMLVHGFVSEKGHVEQLKIVNPERAETDDAVVASLASWEFRAATRDGVPVTVEFLIAIPHAGL